MKKRLINARKKGILFFCIEIFFLILFTLILMNWMVPDGRTVQIYTDEFNRDTKISFRTSKYLSCEESKLIVDYVLFLLLFIFVSFDSC